MANERRIIKKLAEALYRCSQSSLFVQEVQRNLVLHINISISHQKLSVRDSDGQTLLHVLY